MVVHIHFGMSGAFKTASLPGPEPTDTTRYVCVRGVVVVGGRVGVLMVAGNESKSLPEPLPTDTTRPLFWGGGSMVGWGA